MNRAPIKRLLPVLGLILFCLLSSVQATMASGPDDAVPAAAEEPVIAPEQAPSEIEGEAPELAPEVTVADPIEPWNRLMFQFNDKLYFWLVKPAAKGYNAVVPQGVRVSVRNFFHNVTTPVRFVSFLLAGKVNSAGIELARFTTNTTMGIGGLFDVAKDHYHLGSGESDMGLTLGSYGLGEGVYIIWPFLGPSSLRDTVGKVGDTFLDPLSYLTPMRNAIAADGYEYFNDASLRIGEYEDLKESSVEPYIALRSAYIEHRRSLVKK